jgi:ParB family chromosome partitioning protein
MRAVGEPSSTEDGRGIGDRAAGGGEDTPGDSADDGLAELRQIPIERITTPRRPARRFLGDIAALAESMQDFGLQQPISVRADGDRFILTSGMRRLAAARLLHWQTIPGFVRNVSADQAYVLDLIENLQRQDLSPEEEADALGELIRTRGWTLQQVAGTVKRSLAYVSKRVRLFEDALLRDAVVDRGMPVSTAEELLAAPPDGRARLIEQALIERWDQVRARDALRTVDDEALDREAEEDPGEDVPGQPAPATGATAALQPTARPRGFTRTIRSFHRLITELHSKDLTPSDRAALRALFRDLIYLGRASTTPGKTVFPPLPTVTSGSRGSHRRRHPP